MEERVFPRPLPKNREAEQVVLGCAMLEPDTVIPVLLEMLKPEHFYWKTHQMIYNATLELFEKGEGIDLITVGNRLEEKNKLADIGGRAYLSELLSKVTTTTSVQYYADIVKKKAALRALVEAGKEISELGFREEEDLERILDEAEELVFSLSKTELKQSYYLIKDFLHEHFSNLERLQRDPTQHTVTGIPTGFKKFDEMTAGLQLSDLIIIAGRPSMGKSSLATSITRNVAIRFGKCVGIFSLEMTKEQLLERLLCGEAKINLHRLRGGYLEPEAWRRMAEAANKLQKAKIIIDDTPGIPIIELKAKARRMKAEHGLDLLIVDYLQLVEAGGKSDVREQEVAYITRALKGLARELQVPLLALSQLSRAPERGTPRKPRLSDLRECLTGDTVVYHALNGRPYTLKELYDANLLIPVHTVTADLQLTATLPAKIVCSGVKGVYRLRTRTGRQIRASANHPFLTVEGWKPLENLKPRERIAAPRRLPSMGNGALTEEEARLLGYRCQGKAIGRAHLLQVAHKLQDPVLGNLARPDLLWDEIVSIEPCGKELTYDLVVPGTHNFVANDLVVHNSGEIEQTADVVVFVYREYEEPEGEEVEPKGIISPTEIIIGKQRNGPLGSFELSFHRAYASFYESYPEQAPF